MAVFKCKMCGGTLRITEGQSVAVCEYCETQQTLPRLNDDRIADLYDRANHFRRSNDYDKALGMYERILEENKEDAEAYWSIVLCRYGIEYVEDPQTGKRVPTVNRAQFTSILADSDYQAALRYADILQREIYEREAGYIEEIQKNILRVVENEEPYDVFICYKDKDSLGQPTQDRVIATEIYNRLTRENFKVFFAYVTLDEKLGHEFEPYIFSALQSSKVMIVLGTKPEYFNAVWVKNEWSRYLTLIKSGAKKTLITAFKDMDAYDLPDELSLQAQDMEKMGFIENLVYTVRREVERNTETKQQETDTSTIVIKGSEGSTANLVKLAFMALEDKVWRDANLYFDRVLTADPECGIAYAGKLLAELRLSNFDMLGGNSDSFEDHPNYKRAVQYGDDKLKKILEDALTQVKYRIASQMLENRDYHKALQIFENIEYRDSADKAAECQREIENILIAQQERKKQEQISQKKREKQEQIFQKKEKIKSMERSREFKKEECLSEIIFLVYLILVPILILSLVLVFTHAETVGVAVQVGVFFGNILALIILSSFCQMRDWDNGYELAVFLLAAILSVVTNIFFVAYCYVRSIIHLVKFIYGIRNCKRSKQALAQEKAELDAMLKEMDV